MTSLLVQQESTSTNSMEKEKLNLPEAQEELIHMEGVEYTVSKRLFFNFRPSPFPMYISNILYFIPLAVNMVAFDSMLSNKLCYQTHHNQSQCADPSFSYSHPELQEDVANWGTYNTIATLPLTIIMNLMLSSYCDKVGHKLTYVLPVVGNALATGILALLATPQFADWPMATMFGYSFFYSFLGSYPMILMSSFSYIGLAAPRNKRTFAMAIGEGTLLVGVLIGSLINGPIIDSIGLANMLYINVVLTALPLPVVLIFLTDITVKSDRKYTWRDMIGIDHLLDAIRCVFKKRAGNTRLLLNLSFAVYTCGFVAVSGFTALGFLYFVKEKEMSLTLYSIFNSYGSCIKGFGGPALIWLLKRLWKPNQLNLAVVAAASMSAGYIIMAIDSIPYNVWIGAVFFGMQSVFFAINRSLQIGFVEKNELGQLFAYDAIIQTVIGAATTIVFKTFYTATVTVWSGMFLEICAALYIAGLIIFVILVKLKIVDDENRALINDNEL